MLRIKAISAWIARRVVALAARAELAARQRQRRDLVARLERVDEVRRECDYHEAEVLLALRRHDAREFRDWLSDARDGKVYQ